MANNIANRASHNIVRETRVFDDDRFHVWSRPMSLDCAGFPENIPTDAIVIAVDGACFNDGRNGVQAAFGVYVSNLKREYNRSGVVVDQKETNQVAELYAGLEGLNAAQKILDDGALDGLCRVVIKSDSQYLVSAMTDWIRDWRSDGQLGFVNRDNRPVVNGHLMHALHVKTCQMNRRGVQVQFWYQLRCQNTVAERLAKGAAAVDPKNQHEVLDKLFPGTP